MNAKPKIRLHENGSGEMLVYDTTFNDGTVGYQVFDQYEPSTLILELYKNIDGDWSEVMAGTTKKAKDLGRLIDERLPRVNR